MKYFLCCCSTADESKPVIVLDLKRRNSLDVWGVLMLPDPVAEQAQKRDAEYIL
jgi:hypothetical protein